MPTGTIADLGVARPVEPIERKPVLGQRLSHPVGGSLAVHRHHGGDPPAPTAAPVRETDFGIPGSCVEASHLQHRVGWPGGAVGIRR